MSSLQEDTITPTTVMPARSKKSRLSALQIEQSRVEAASLAHKVEVLGNLLSLSRMEEAASKPGEESENGTFVYVSALSPKAHDIIAAKLIELVKQF